MTQQNPTTRDVTNPHKEISEGLTRFATSAALFSNRPGLIEDYDTQWVAVLDGEVRAQADDVDALFAAMDAGGLDPRITLVRHVRRNQRTLIV